MIKIFIPEIKRKYNKPNARGFWRNDSGKIYYDYIKIVNYNQPINGFYYSTIFNRYMDNLQLGYNQEAIFFVNNNIGNIYYSSDKIQILPHRIIKEVLKNNLKIEIKRALGQYGGCTVYKNQGKYYIEVFTTI